MEMMMTTTVARRIGIEEVEKRVNKKKTVIYERMKKGTFPSRNQDGWLEEDIDYYVRTGTVKAAANGDQAAA
jgi:predicted DNA-binding transcriptional regulator AlpA